MRPRALLQAAVAGLLALSLGCKSARVDAPDAGAQSLDAGVAVERIPVIVNGDQGPVTFQAELADTPQERAVGLMHRTSMEDGHGMIFLFPDERQRSFWMRNTLIPLDMLFIKADRSVLGVVANARPKTDDPRMVPGGSQFVLEINAGLAAKHGLRAGATVEFFAPLPER